MAGGVDAGTVYVDVKPDTSAMTGKSSGMATAMKTAGLVAAGAFAVSFIKGGLAEAKEAEKVGLMFADSFSRGTEGFNSDAMSGFFDDVNNELGVSDEELQTWAAHLNNAIDFTKFKDGEAALKSMTMLIPDLAAASGKSASMVEKTVKTIGTAPEASVTALRKLGAITDEQAARAAKMLAAGKTVAAQEYLVAKAHENTSGAAAAQVTDSEALSIQYAELQEMVGAKLLPILNGLATAGMKVVDFLTSGSGASKALMAALGLLAAGMVVVKVNAALAGAQLAVTAVGGLGAWIASTSIATTAQWAWNAALSANPLGLIVAAIIAVIAVVVILWKKNETFRKIVLAAWAAIKSAILKVWDAIKAAGAFVFKVLATYVKTWWAVAKAVFTFLWGAAKSAFDKVVGIVKGAWSLITDAFEGGKEVFSRVFDAMTAPARAAFNGIAQLWNSTVGSLSFTVPDWVPKIGGSGWNVPDIPLMGDGGIVTRPTLAVVGEAGPEAVIPLSGAGGAGMSVRIVDSNLGLVMDGVLERGRNYADSRGRAVRA